jgi:hypothetical protein
VNDAGGVVLADRSVLEGWIQRVRNANASEPQDGHSCSLWISSQSRHNLASSNRITFLVTILDQRPARFIRTAACQLIHARVLFLLVCLSGAVGVSAAQEPPLPDLEALKADVKARILEDRVLRSQYTYLERRGEIEVSKLGRVTDGPVKVYEVYPSPEPGNTYKRLISVNGTPLSPEELERNDTIHRRDVLARLNESPAKKVSRQREEAKDRAEEAALVDELFHLYDMKIVRRESLDGHPTLVVALEPRPDYRTRTDAGRVLKRVRMKAWVHETEHQIVRVDAEAIDDITIGWGLIGRLYKGTKGQYLRRKVNDEVWMPAKASLVATGRALLVRGFQLDSTTEWWGYKKFKVKTEEMYRQN